MSSLDRLHDAIGTAERLALIRDSPIAEIGSAPDHRRLRDPEAVGATGRTAQISGAISSLDRVFPEPERGVPLAALLSAWRDAGEP